MSYFPVPEYARDAPEEDHRGLLIRSSIVMACLSTTAVALRFLSRKLTRVHLLADDWTILAALPFALMLCAIDIYGPFHTNFGRHLQYSTPETLQRFFEATFAFELGYNFAITLPKFSMLALYSRIFGFSSFKWPIVFTGTTCFMFFVGCTFTAIFSCTPISDYWNNPGGRNCLDHVDYYIGQAVANITLDLVLMLLPVIPIRSLQMSVSQKVAVSAIFFVGIFVTICSGLRLDRLINTMDITAVDPSFELVDAAVWSVIETNLAIVCACLPSMRPLLRAILHGKLRTTDPSASHQSGNRQSMYDSTVAANQKRRSQIKRQSGLTGINKEQHTAITSVDGRELENIELGYHATITADHCGREDKEIDDDSRSFTSTLSRIRKAQVPDEPMRHEHWPGCNNWLASPSSNSVEGDRKHEPVDWPLGSSDSRSKDTD